MLSIKLNFYKMRKMFLKCVIYLHPEQKNILVVECLFLTFSYLSINA